MRWEEENTILDLIDHTYIWWLAGTTDNKVQYTRVDPGQVHISNCHSPAQPYRPQHHAGSFVDKLLKADRNMLKFYMQLLKTPIRKNKVKHCDRQNCFLPRAQRHDFQRKQAGLSRATLEINYKLFL